MHDSTTRGTLQIRVSKPMCCSSRYCMTPVEALRPKALPPLSRMAWMPDAAAMGLRSSDSRLAGPPPRTSTAQGALSGNTKTVQPVPPWRSWALPRRNPFVRAMANISISFMMTLPFISFFQSLSRAYWAGCPYCSGIYRVYRYRIPRRYRGSKSGRFRHWDKCG